MTFVVHVSRFEEMTIT